MKLSRPAFFCAQNLFVLSMLAFSLALALALPTSAQTALARISVDNLTNSDSDHKTEVEPDMFSWGNTIVTAFHVARRPGSIGWGSGDIGYSTSLDGGKTWRSPRPHYQLQSRNLRRRRRSLRSLRRQARRMADLNAPSGGPELQQRPNRRRGRQPLHQRPELGQSHQHRQDSSRR